MAAPMPRTLTRKELYDLVWSTPIRLLAPRFEISDVGLAKICKKHAIPCPTLGYWAKVQHGQRIRKTPLPALPAGVDDVVRFRVRPHVPRKEDSPPGPAFDSALMALAVRIERDSLAPAVASSLHGCHEVTRRTREWLEHKSRKPTRNKWGELEPWTPYEGSFALVEVGKEHYHRALLILDAAIKTLIALGARVVEPKQPPSQLVSFEFREVHIEVRIEERHRQVPHVPTKDEEEIKRRTGHSWAPRHDLVPTGELRVELFHSEHRAKFAEVCDSKTAKLEEKMNEFALAVVRYADANLKRRADAEESRRRAAEAARLAREDEERRRQAKARHDAELARRERLLQLAVWLDNKRSLSRFVTEVRERAADTELAPCERAALDRWLVWAEEVVQALDPFRDGLMWLPEFTHETDGRG